MEVEHLWQYNEGEARSSGGSRPAQQSAGNSTDLMANLCNIADHRLYKIVKWCKSLPLFKNISVSSSLLASTYRFSRTPIIPINWDLVRFRYVKILTIGYDSGIQKEEKKQMYKK